MKNKESQQFLDADLGIIEKGEKNLKNVLQKLKGLKTYKKIKN